MPALLALAYGLLAYTAGSAALAWFIAFSANLGVPHPVDGAATLPWPQAVAVDLVLLALFGLQHSLMARQGFKRWWTRWVPAALERSTYLLATAAVLALLCAAWQPMPAPQLWQVTHPAAVALLWALFALGWALVLASTWMIDHWALFGLRQVLALWRRQPPSEDGFRTPLLYRHVRHPLYLGLLLGLWSGPAMSAGRLLLAGGLSAYIAIGIVFEERDLVRRFGAAYLAYQRQVGMLLPRLRGRISP